MLATHLLLSQATGWIDGWKNAGEILGKASGAPLTNLEKMAGGVGQAMENLTFCMLKASEVAKGETGIQKFFYNLIAKPFETSDADLIAQGEAGQKKKMADDQKRQALYAAQRADPAFNHPVAPVADQAKKEGEEGTPTSSSLPPSGTEARLRAR